MAILLCLQGDSRSYKIEGENQHGPVASTYPHTRTCTRHAHAHAHTQVLSIAAGRAIAHQQWSTFPACSRTWVQFQALEALQH